MDYLEPESDDPLHDPPEGSLIWQLGAKGCRVRAHDDLAVVKFCVQCRTSLTHEGDLIRLRSHHHYASQSATEDEVLMPR